MAVAVGSYIQYELLVSSPPNLVPLHVHAESKPQCFSTTLITIFSFLISELESSTILPHEFFSYVQLCVYDSHRPILVAKGTRSIIQQ